MKVAAVLLMLCGLLEGQATGITDAVRQARDRSNRAIAARNLPAYTATITPDFIITTGSGKSYTREQFLEQWSKLLADPNWHGCDRIVDGIEMSTSQSAAAEHGHFVCGSKQPDGDQVYTGTYLAMWRNDDGKGWRTRSELFVTLACSGSAVCKAPKL